ncbi:MAG TPA: OmpH family outer membrane protein [Parafilimonas sp.]|nr:OmpH family outer membrane protein [Parafilimonas sp.]
MKKVFLAAVCVTALSFGFTKSNAQTAPAFKIGVFDLDLMVRALPEYRSVDSLTQLYERDTLAQEYQIYMSEYQRLDSTWKSDSAAGKPKSVLDYTFNQKQQMQFNLVYWQQIAQNKSDQYRGTLAGPLYQRVVAAYKKVVAAKKYNLILKPDSYEVGFPIENMFPLVAKEMNVTLPPGLTVDPNQALQEMGTNAAGAVPTKP